MVNSERLDNLLQRLHLTPSDLARYAAPMQLEAKPNTLSNLGITDDDRVLRATPDTIQHWTLMQQAALKDGIHLIVTSAFRSVDYQRKLIEKKLAHGETPSQILKVVALPGYSEHHTGQALDIITPACPSLTEAFEQSDAFAWLSRHAHQFGFSLSYPRNNPWGFVYEPWHWRFNLA